MLNFCVIQFDIKPNKDFPAKAVSWIGFDTL